MPTAEPIIEAQGLVKRYGGHVAVNGLDLTVYTGEIFGILGPNGAGKTTTLEMIEGLRAPDAGTIRVAGLDPATQGDAVRRLIGVQLQSTSLFDLLTIAELVELFAGLYGADDSPERVAALIAMVGLTEKRRARVDQLSGGQRQRVAIALALVNQPRIVFLDEPTTGLDPVARRALWATVHSIRDEGATVVLTTHYMEEADVLCDRVAVMDHGQIVACDTPAALVRSLRADATIRARLSGPLPMAELAALPSAIALDCGGDERCADLRLQTTDAQTTLIGLLALATRESVALAGLTTAQATLEDVFLHYTGRAYEVGEPAAERNERRGRRRRGIN
ncbi:MAG: ABC transporter ATP-binding protein [Thermomicrobiales bacterium]|nr:ABC transporter ATP-binding protein [Thermomicrobiales bacterium]